MVLHVVENRLRGGKRRYVAGERAEDKAHQRGIPLHTIHAVDILVNHGFDVVYGFLVGDARVFRKDGFGPSTAADDMRIIRHRHLGRGCNPIRSIEKRTERDGSARLA